MPLERLLSNPTVANLLLLLAVWTLAAAVWEVDRAWTEEGRGGARRVLKNIAFWILGYALLCLWFVFSMSWGGDPKSGLFVFFAGLIAAGGIWLKKRQRG